MSDTERPTEQLQASPLGRIPKTWEVKPLGDLSILVTSGSRGWSAYYSESGALFVRIGNLTREHINLRLDDVVFVQPPRHGEGQRTQLMSGDLLISITADLGIIGVVPANLGTAYVNQHIALLRINPGVANSRWLGHFMSGPDGQRQVRRLDDSGAKAGLNLPTVKSLLAPLPPLPVQRAIADVLDAIDDAIRKTEQIIAKLQQVKQGLLHDLLTRGIDDNGELRDPERNPEQFQNSPLGRIPKAWEVRALGNVVSGGFVNGVFKEPERTGRGCPLLNVGDLYGGFGVDLRRVERFDASPVERSRFAVRPGDVFFTRSSLTLAGIAHCNIVRTVTEESVFDCHVMRVRPDKRLVDATFLAAWCRSPSARTFFMARAKQVTMTTISQPDIFPLPVPVPALEEQRRLIDSLDAIEARIESEAVAAAKLSHVKSALAEDLLTGRVRTTSPGEVAASGSGT